MYPVPCTLNNVQSGIEWHPITSVTGYDSHPVAGFRSTVQGERRQVTGNKNQPKWVPVHFESTITLTPTV